MNTKVNVLLAPKIEEAVGDKLSVGKLVNVATGIVPVYSGAKTDDVITLTVNRALATTFTLSTHLPAQGSGYQFHS
ncbi:hypothetical protein [Pseudomonas sp. SM4]|uniref:hypothetical protein n=1 Tax=Pseudomonas sp. SM4 TaxID=3424177 RepID=UPI003F7AB8D3